MESLVRLTAVNRALLSIVWVGIGLIAGGCSTDRSAREHREGRPTSDKSQPAARGGDVVDSEIIPVGDSPVRGPADAPVTIVVFAEFLSPFSARAEAIGTALRDQYGDEIRVVHKYGPPTDTPGAGGAPRAAWAARRQDGFWAMHDYLFAHQTKLHGATVGQIKELAAAYAVKRDLAVDQFESDFDAAATKDIIAGDRKLADKLGVDASPASFVNGIQLQGAPSLKRVRDTIDAQLEAAKKKRLGGTDSSDLYRSMVAENYQLVEARREPTAPADGRPARRAVQIPIHPDDAVRGSEDALVTVVEFADFQCPFSAQAQSTLDRLVDNYGDQVRIVYKYVPRWFAKPARDAAKVAMAAQQHDVFWKMHDLLYAHQLQLYKRGGLRELANHAGLTDADVEHSLHNDAFAGRIKREIEFAAKLNLHKTPTFFINGIQVVGAQPYDTFATLIDDQLELARALQDRQHVSGDKLYKAVLAYNVAGWVNWQAAGSSGPQKHGDVGELTVDSDQAKGPVDADVTVYVFADFQCPHCRIGAQRFSQAVAAVSGSVRVVFKHDPLAADTLAEPAARAAMAAGEQGKFWPMHDLLYRYQQRLGERGIYEELANELNLDLAKFNKDRQRAVFGDQIDADKRQAEALGIDQIPTYIIGGAQIVGAQSPIVFERVLEDAVKNH